MAAESAEFLELVGPEMTVDLDRLRDIAFYGIPDDVRAQVWMVLLPALLATTGSSAAAIDSEDAMEEAAAAAAASAASSSAGNNSKNGNNPVANNNINNNVNGNVNNNVNNSSSSSSSNNNNAGANSTSANGSIPGGNGPAGAGTGNLAAGGNHAVNAGSITVSNAAAGIQGNLGGNVVDDLRDEVVLEESLGPAVVGNQHDGLTEVEIVRVLQSEMNRFERKTPRFRSAKIQKKIFNLLFDYLERTNSTTWHIHHAALVHAAAPFALLMRKESDAKTCFQYLMRALDSYFGEQNGRTTLGRFLMLFRSRLPELFTHFEEEDIEGVRWASSWLQWLLCRELPFNCCLRLWDSYFAAPDGHGFELHTFVCLAILENCQADLVELEHGEIVAFLQNLPALDMDRIIVQAQYMAHDFRTAELQELTSTSFY